MKILLSVLLTLAAVNLCFAQQNVSNLHFNHVGVRDGLPEGRVTPLLQDRQGYIWLGTQKGVVRYDGYAPKVYDLGSQDPYGINIRKVYEDARGQLWAITLTNLYKYDRSNDRFVNYATWRIRETSSIIEDQEGHLWLGFYDDSLKKVLMRFDPQTKKGEEFGGKEKGNHQFNAKGVDELFIDRGKRICVGSSNGFYVYDKQTNSFIPHLTSTEETKQISVKHFQEDATQPGVYYFHDWKNYPSYKAEGLCRYNSNTATATWFRHDNNVKNSLASDTIWRIKYDAKGTLWLLTAAGMSRFDPATQTFTNFSSSGFRSPASFLFSLDFIEDKKGNFWCTSASGLFYFDVAAGTFTQSSMEQNAGSGLADDLVHDFMLDSSGTLWFGAGWQNGLQWINTPGSRITRYAPTGNHHFSGGLVNSFAQTKNGSLYLGASNGLYRWLRNNDSFEQINFTPLVIERTGVYSLISDSKGSLWFGAYTKNAGEGGLYCYDPTSRKSTHYRPNPKDTASLPSKNVSRIYEDHLGTLWIGTSGGGICRFNTETKTFTRYPFISNNNTNIDTTGALDDDEVICLYEDKEGVLWVGTNNGSLNRFDREKGTFTSYLGKKPGLICVTSITEDNNGCLWIGTYFGGLFKLNKDRNSIERFTEKEGLLYDGIFGLANDGLGNIWATSLRGISIINAKTNSVRTLPEFGELSFGNAFIKQTATGELITNTSDGFTVLNPYAFALDSHAPVIHIETVHLLRQEKDKSIDSVIVVVHGKSLQFGYDENRLSFQYVGLQYQDVDRVRYAYKLDGYDRDWVQAGTLRSVTYTNLPSATYTFHVKAANSDGVWSTTEDSIAFVISPPWYKTWWAYLLFAIVFLAALRAYIVFRSRSLLRHNRILEEKVSHRTHQLSEANEELKSTQEEIVAQRDELAKTVTTLQMTQAQLIQSEKMASLGELTAGIAHEIQNPLNFVNNFSEVNKELIAEMKAEIDKGNIEEVKAIANDVEENEQKINYHGKRADAIVKGMLQHSRANTGKKEPTDINALADEYLRLSYHGLRAKDKDFNAGFTTHFDATIGEVEVVPQDIGRVLLNLFNNAFYAANEKKRQLNGAFEPTVTVTTKRVGDKIEISVKDNGNGIPQKVVDKIFQPFFTTKPTGQGTGLGLSLSYDIIKAHGGDLRVEIKEGEGAEFTIQLPVFT